jgi:hypothetical protein
MLPAIEYFFSELHAKTGQQALKLRPFQDFVTRVVGTLDSSPGSFWRCRDALADLTISRAALDYVESELMSGLTTPHYLPQLDLFECDRFSLALRFLFPSQQSNTVSAFIEHRMMAVVHGSAHLYRFEQPHVEPLDILDQERKIMSLGASTLSAGNVLASRAAVDCYQLSVDAPAIVFEMRSEPIYNFQWFYDSVSLVPKRIVYVDSRDMRAHLGLLTALNLKSPESVPQVRSFLGHSNHFIRWSALKAIIQLDPDKVATYLDDAAHDCHPQIRAAAVQLKAQVEKAKVAHGANTTH